MQIAIETVAGLERRITFSVPAEDVDKQVHARLQKATGTVKLAGFRPGKVPVSEVKRRYGQSIRQEVISEVTQAKFYQVIHEANIKPAGMPTIEAKPLADDDLTFTATFEVYPDIELADFTKLSVEKLTGEVADQDIDQMIENLRKNHMQWHSVNRSAKSDDQVTIDFQGMINNESFQGGDAKDVPLVLGSNSMIEGFESGLIGTKSGEEKVLDLTFPEDYQNNDLAGQDVQFKVQIKQVAESELPELNDEFFARFGVKQGGFEQFRNDIADSMAKELEQAINSLVKKQVMEGLLEKHQLVVPSRLVDSEIGRLKQQFMQQLGGKTEISPDQLPNDMFEKEAKRRVELGLIISAIIEKKTIELDQQRVQNWIEEKAKSYQEPQQMINWYASNQQAMAQVESMVLEEQVVEHILALAKVAEQKSSYQEIMESVK